ncbi:copper resistance CopC family protein [Candidatus Palauibacter sp.]|uniref:copper resistance CopC family protein n=1 Tax=Candidatus Palauibacter sp. TaxID=3101350 RepID=UPI003AF230BB
MRKPGRTGVLIAMMAAGLGVTAAGGGGASHLALKESSPKKDETVSASPETVTLWFTQAPQMAGTSVRLLPTGGEPMELEAATAHEDDPTVVILTVSETLADGDYQVMWRAMAQDGHTIRGDFGFAVSTAR